MFEQNPFVFALFVAGVLSLVASSLPDGLEKAARDQGFLERETVLFAAPFADYLVFGIGDDALVTSIAGVLGSGLLFLILSLFGRAIFRVDVSKSK